MDVEIKASGWTGDFAGFLAFLRADPQFYATSREQLLEKASEMAKRADGGLDLGGRLPQPASTAASSSSSGSHASQRGVACGRANGAGWNMAAAR